MIHVFIILILFCLPDFQAYEILKYLFLYVKQSADASKLFKNQLKAKVIMIRVFNLLIILYRQVIKLIFRLKT